MTPMSDVAQTVRAFPVSVKGVLVRDGQVLLLKNEREEWELPGGKLELGEEPPVCVAREITEETGLLVTTGPILDAWQYHIREGRDVLIVTYGCHPQGSQAPTLSDEHKEIGFFTQAEVSDLNMPAGYKHSIRSWFALLTAADDIEA
jgi:8-oxo-dGTP pyrophosphatase MutT (NUDIX family)